MVQEDLSRKLVAVLHADVKGYSAMMGRDDEATVQRLSLYRQLFDELIGRHDGRIVDTAGDSVLAEFGSAVHAVRCAVEIQRGLESRNADLASADRMQFRIGVNLGDVVVKGNAIFGDGVNIAARLEALAEPGGICISGSIYEQVKSRLKFAFEDMGAQSVKNISELVRAYRFVPDAPAAGMRAPQPSGALAIPDKPSIAVLPFDNMSGDPEQVYFSDGITEDIITDLSKISALFVIARNSSFSYKGSAVKVQQVSRELGVRFVLEGSVRKAGNRVRITAQLIDAQSGGHVWAERYDRDLEDIFTVQDEVTQMIVTALEVKLTQAERQHFSAKFTDNLEAYDCVLRAGEQFSLFTRHSVTRARTLYTRAIELDPGYATAFAGLAKVYLFEWITGWCQSREQTVHRAHELAKKAVSLDDDLWLGHAMLGWTSLWLAQHEQAIAEGERAIALDPNSADSRVWLAMSLSWAGRPEEGRRLIENAMRLNPHYPVLYLFALGHTYFMTERYDDAADALQRGIACNAEFLPNYVFLAATYALLNRKQEAQAAVEVLKRISPDYKMSEGPGIFKNPRDTARLREGLRRAGLQ